MMESRGKEGRRGEHQGEEGKRVGRREEHGRNTEGEREGKGGGRRT